MEILKKSFYQILTTGATTGGTNYFKFIPDTGVTYNLSFSLESNIYNLGYFDPYYFSGVTPTVLINKSYVVTGYSLSRLSELRKSTVTSDITKQYFLSSDSSVNGLDLDNSSFTGNTYIYTYYLDGITYVDTVPLPNTYNFAFGYISGTSFSFIENTNNPNKFLDESLIFDENKGNVYDIPITKNDVFILRQENSVFEKNYNLEFIKNISQLETFAGGQYFNIIKNS